MKNDCSAQFCVRYYSQCVIICNRINNSLTDSIYDNNVIEFVRTEDYNKFVNYTHLTQNERRYLNGEQPELTESELDRLEKRGLLP